MYQKVNQVQDINEQGGGWEKNQTSLVLVLLKLFANPVTQLSFYLQESDPHSKGGKSSQKYRIMDWFLRAGTWLFSFLSRKTFFPPQCNQNRQNRSLRQSCVACVVGKIAFGLDKVIFMTFKLKVHLISYAGQL